MNKKKCLAGLATGAIIAAQILTGCSGSKAAEDNSQAALPAEEEQKEEAGTLKESPEEEAEKQVIRFGYWGDAATLEAYEFAIDGLEEEVPGVEIEFVQYPTDQEFWDTLPSQIAAKTAPDIINFTNERYLEFIKNDFFNPIDESVIDKENTSQISRDVWTVDGKLYGVPNTAAPAVFFINMDMWKEAGLSEEELPKTWEDVREAARKLTKDGQYGLGINVDAEFALTQYALSFKGGWGEGTTINTPENAAAMDYIMEMFEEGLATSPKRLGLGWDGEAFAQNKVAMTTGGYWYIAHMKAAAPNTNYAAIPIPQVDPENPAFALHSNAYSIVKSDKDVTLLSKVINYMTRVDAQLNEMKSRGSFPPNTEIVKQYFELNPNFAEVEKVIDKGNPFGYPVQSQKFANLLINNLGKVIYSDEIISGNELLQEVETEFNK